jgi:hypothetical protein
MTSPLKRAIDRSHDMAVRLSHKLIFIKDRYARLETANKKQVRKRATSKKQISHEGSLRSLEEIGPNVVEGNIYLQRKVLQNHQQSLSYPLYLLYGARSPVLIAELKGILILDVLQKLFSHYLCFRVDILRF